MKEEELLPVSEMIQGAPERSMREPILALFAGFIIIGVAWWQYQLMLSAMELIGWMGMDWITELVLELYFAMFVLGMLSGGMVILGGLIMYAFKPKVGGIITIIFSLISFTGGGGFMIGLVLGMVAGILGLQEKKPPEPGSSGEIL